MKMLTNRNTLIVKLNLITMPEQIIKVSECQPTTVWRIVVQRPFMHFMPKRLLLLRASFDVPQPLS
ncbi:hypothetical protein EC950083_0389, partial [Escherichia coli 95.0083]